MPAVTISAGYGAGGSVVAPRVAESLGLPLLDRAINARIAEQLHVTVEEAQGGAVRRSLVERFFGVLAPLAGGVTGIDADGNVDVPSPMNETVEFRAAAERIVREQIPTGVVVLGRAGASMLRDEKDALRVRLFGPQQARVEQAARIQRIDADTAAARLPEVDRARAQYVKRLYDCDIDDPQLFDLQIDSTRVPLDSCAELIVQAYRSLA